LPEYSAHFYATAIVVNVASAIERFRVRHALELDPAMATASRKRKIRLETLALVSIRADRGLGGDVVSGGLRGSVLDHVDQHTGLIGFIGHLGASHRNCAPAVAATAPIRIH
jgi:hypothetical protein